MSSSTRWLVVGLAIVVLGAIALSGMARSQGTWVCKDGLWTPEGSPSLAKPTEGCGLTSEQTQQLVHDYLRAHITSLSPERAVLGGTFYLTEVTFPTEGVALVSYEDGHIALRARATYAIEGNEVRITAFTLIELPPAGQRK